ncbi:hypothetical protein H5410_056612 [Solanum commersonii]|uniref:Uncharacterized protein n=1 Tax=Solanum commersonii TaxID=4109 RepID=A0A9J5WNK6_SOLCO|nr:hypothetical protein H5410_056612 [Solanum commersonii]
MPDEWRWSTMVPLYKNKGDIQNCNNYRGIKLLSHTMKIWKRMVEMRVRRGCTSRESALIHAGRSTTKPFILSLRPAYDKVPANVILRCFEAEPFLFALVMDELTRPIRRGPMVNRLMKRDVVNARSRCGDKRWSPKGSVEGGREVRLATRIIPKRESFKYLGSQNPGSGDIDEDVTHRMGLASESSCDKKIPSRLKASVGHQECTCPKMHVGDEDVEMDVLGTQSDKIRNQVILGEGGSGLVDKPREARPRWFGHVSRRAPDAPNGETGLGSPSPYRDMTLDRKEWRFILRSRLVGLAVVFPWWFGR